MTQKNIKLTRTGEDDLPFFYEFQLDKEANHLAAFTSENMEIKEAYLEKYTKFLNDPTINMQTVSVNGIIAGSIAKFIRENTAEITYWLDKKFWGQGIATSALKDFLKFENTRPLYGCVAFDNIPSQRVLEKCGFVKAGTDSGFAYARQKIIEEYIFRLS